MEIINNYNPDVLNCLANLSSDEVFTPPNLANQMLDLLPKNIWSNKEAKFLDPVCKSGVFLREIAKRLMTGLEKEIPNEQKRINHIFQNQLYGIAITELTSLLSRRSVYCSKKANGKYSVCDSFKTEEGNILFNRIEHTWDGSKCKFCGASKAEYGREDILETHAYELIHTDKPNKIFNEMKFDVIIGNPPYQLSDSGHGRSAGPIYHLFVEQAKKLNPKYLTMIIPSRWFVGGKGLDNFRSEMLNDKRIRTIVDFENSNDVFPGVDVAGGICYFLWNRNNAGECETVSIRANSPYSTKRSLNEFPVFVRDSRAIPIIKKVLEYHGKGRFLKDVVTSRKPFGMPTNYEPKKSGVPCWFIQRIGLKYASKADVTDDYGIINKWKLLIPPAPIAGQTDFSKPVGFYYEGNMRIAKPGECCTESWIVAYASSSKAKVESFKSYLLTKTVRFLLLQSVISQHVVKQNFLFVPDIGNYEKTYTDEELVKRWKITDDEWKYIDSRISNYGR